MTPSERQWLQDTRRAIRLSLMKIDISDWSGAVYWIGGALQKPLVTGNTCEIVNMLASVVLLDPKNLAANAAMRAALVRRLEEAKALIGETLVATTDP